MRNTPVLSQSERLAKAAKLETIFFQELHGALRDKPIPPPEGGEMALELHLALGRKKPAADDLHREFRIESHFVVPHPLAELVVRVVAQYQVPMEFAEMLDDDKVLSEFARIVAIPDVVPYVREALASLTQRMGMRAFVLPAIPKDTINI